MKLYYFIDRERVRQGPLPLEDLKAYDIKPATLVWCKGMPKWEKAKDVEDFSALLKSDLKGETNNNENETLSVLLENCQTTPLGSTSSHINEAVQEERVVPNQSATKNNRIYYIILLLAIAAIIGVAVWFITTVLSDSSDDMEITEQIPYERIIYQSNVNVKNCFIVISKKSLSLKVYEGTNTDTTLVAVFPACLSKNKGQKYTAGDNKTPECSLDKPFRVNQIEDASTWRYDFGDGRGSILAYGHWFIRLNSEFSGIGIMGSTNNEQSVPGRESSGSIRLKDDDLDFLKEHYVFEGMKVVIKSEEEGLYDFEKRCTIPMEHPQSSRKLNQSSSSLERISVSSQEDYTDLGLSVLWSNYNVGASDEMDYGNLYGWGNTQTYLSTDLSQYPCANPPRSIKETRFDVAQALWGGKWRMPTLAELRELKDACDWNRVEYSYGSFYKVTGPNGNSILLPLSGYKKGDEYKNVGEWGFIWSSELYEGNSQFAANLSFGGKKGIVETSGYYRYGGESIRPVMDKR